MSKEAGVAIRAHHKRSCSRSWSVPASASRAACWATPSATTGRTSGMPTLVDALNPHVEWVSVCPEVEIGMGTPREPVGLVARAHGVPSSGARVRLLGRQHRRRLDRPDADVGMGERLEALTQSSGCPAMSSRPGSPSCGIHGVPVHAETDGERVSRGLFAQVLITALPDLPVADEEELTCTRPAGMTFSDASAHITVARKLIRSLANLRHEQRGRRRAAARALATIRYRDPYNRKPWVTQEKGLSTRNPASPSAWTNKKRKRGRRAAPPESG